MSPDELGTIPAEALLDSGESATIIRDFKFPRDSQSVVSQPKWVLFGAVVLAGLT